MDNTELINGKLGIYKKYKIADLKVYMHIYYNHLLSYAKKYECDWDGEADITIDYPLEKYEKIRKEKFPASMHMVEYMYSGMIFFRHLLFHSGMMLHASAVVLDKEAYLFSANSGGGKSTHTKLWLDYFKDRAYILNDDKPLIRKVDGEWIAYGGPWSGKTDLSENKKAKLKSIVFVNKSSENQIEKLSKKRAVGLVISQTQKRFYQEKLLVKVLDIVEKITDDIPIYQMQCDISTDAVEMAYNAIRRE